MFRGCAVRTGSPPLTAGRGPAEADSSADRRPGRLALVVSALSGAAWRNGKQGLTERRVPVVADSAAGRPEGEPEVVAAEVIVGQICWTKIL